LIKDGAEKGAPLVKNDYSWNKEANVLWIE